MLRNRFLTVGGSVTVTRFPAGPQRSL